MEEEQFGVSLEGEDEGETLVRRRPSVTTTTTTRRRGGI